MNDYDLIKTVSVVILAYNNYEYLTDCIKSLAVQTYNDIELIIADDGSRDIDEIQIRNVVSSLTADRFQVQYLFNKTNLGTVKNYNHAIKCSKGELIVPLSMDDCMADEFVIENIVNYFNKNQIMLGTSYICYVKDSEFRVGPSENEIKRLDDSFQTAEELLTMGLFFKGANTYYHKKIFEKYGSFDETYRLYEDVPFLFQYLNSGNKVSVVPHVCILYSIRGGGVSSKKNVHKALVADRELLYNRILKNPEYKKIHRWVKYNLYRNLYPGKNAKAAVRFPDIIIRKAFRILLSRNKWIKYQDRNEIIAYIRKINDRLNAQNK